MKKPRSPRPRKPLSVLNIGTAKGVIKYRLKSGLSPTQQQEFIAKKMAKVNAPKKASRTKKRV